MDWKPGTWINLICLTAIFRVFRQVFPTLPWASFILYTIIWTVLRMTGCNLIVLCEYLIFHSLYSLTEFYEHHTNNIHNWHFKFLLHCMFKCSCIIRMYFFSIYNLHYFCILWNFTCTIFGTVFVLFLYCVFVLLLCCVLSCILYFETCFISICCLTGLFIYETNMHLCMYWASCKVPVD